MFVQDVDNPYKKSVIISTGYGYNNLFTRN